MKSNNNNRLYLISVLLGAVCLALRIFMLNTGIDDKGLLIRGNIPNIIMWVITVGYLIVLGVMTKNLGVNGTYHQNFPQSNLGGWLSMAGGIIMVTVIFDGTAFQRVLAGAAAGCMIFSGYCRYVRMRPNFWFHGIVCIHFLISLITKYQGWSSNPQLHEYGFQTLACVMLVLYACHRSAGDFGLIQRRRLVYTGMAACFFCIISLSDSSAPGFYAGAALWTAGSMCSLEYLPEVKEE